MICKIAQWFRVESWQFIFLFASPLLSWIAWQAAGEGGLMNNSLVAILAWFLAIVAALVGSFKIYLSRSRPEPRSLILPLVLTVAAFLARALALDRVPIALTGDEGSAGIAATQILHGNINNPFISTGYSFPSLYYFFQALSIHLFGQTTEALRITSALAGALTVTAVYYVGRTLLDRRTGLFAAIFLAAYAFHIHFSRIGLNNIWDGLWYIIVLGFLWRGWEKEENKSFAVAGLCLGIAQYFYPSGRALVIPIAGWLLLIGFSNREKFKRVFPAILILFLVTLVVVLPLAIYYLHHPAEYMAPFRRVTIFGAILDAMVQTTGQPAWLILLKQIWLGLEGFIYVPLRFWYQPGTPLLRPITASLFVFGLLMLFVRGRKSRFLLLMLWILTFGLIGGLSESTPASQRYVAAAPVCALLVGYGLSEIGVVIEALWPRFQKSLNVAVIVFAILIAADELNFYFNVYTPKSAVDFSHSNSVIAQHLADYLKNKPSDLQVIFMGAPFMGYYSIPSLQYLAPQVQGIDAFPPWEIFDKSAITGKSLLFVFLPGNETALRSVEIDYPGGLTYAERASDGAPLYWYYEYNFE
jgi:4-amino-4-deoxy-L-arabinose transferase-like glycosyltransferase